jgi:formylglycine-generating enzyme required for sulfatase activity
LSRLFISHSSKDNIAAIAFKQWLGSVGWPDEDVFLDVDSIGAGERWREALRLANARCEAVVLLASPDALSSPECVAEVRKAEDFGKEIIVILLRDLQFDDHRLDSFKDRQIVDLAAPPRDHIETVGYRGERQEVRFNEAGLARVKDFLAKRGIAPDRFAWPPPDEPDAEPFPGLSAFAEDDAGIFFGRDADIVRGLDRLRILRRNGSPRLLVIQASSGAGKSSFLRAGLWPRLNRDPDFAPLAILRPAQGILTGPQGLGGKLAALLSRPWQPVSPGEVHGQLMAQDVATAASGFTRLMATAAAEAHERRRIGDRDARAPALILAVDQAEELFGSDDKLESDRFLFLLARVLRQPPSSVEVFCLFTIRSDGAAQLFQTVADLDLEIPETLLLLPLPQTAYRDVILKPLDVLARRGQRLTLSPELADRLVVDATGADALPLLAFTISHLYREFAATGTLTPEQYGKIGGIAGSIDMALKQTLARPSDTPAIPAAREDQFALLRATFIPWLAHIDSETGVPMRRVARLDEFPQGAGAIVERLIEARLLVADRRSGTDVVEVAHESLLRQWPALTAWLQTDADDLKLVDAIERAAKEWARNGKQDGWLDHRAERLSAALRVVARPDFSKRIHDEGAAYLAACESKEQTERKEKEEALAREQKGVAEIASARSRARQMRAVAAVLVVGALAGLSYAGWLNQTYLKIHVPAMIENVWPMALNEDAEAKLKPKAVFKECASCPKMVLVPAGQFMMGSSAAEKDHGGDEEPRHRVSIPKAFAVSQYEITFDEWDACVALGGCKYKPDDEGWGRGRRPVINISWDDAHDYLRWLQRHTGKQYRLLSEAEWEYAARAGSEKAYWWGDEIGKGNANCNGCNEVRLGPTLSTAFVGSFPANPFGLYDMNGNVSEWVEDCDNDSYTAAPSDGSAWTSGGCFSRVIRGGSWTDSSPALRSARRDRHSTVDRVNDRGIRIARTLTSDSQFRQTAEDITEVTAAEPKKRNQPAEGKWAVPRGFLASDFRINDGIDPPRCDVPTDESTEPVPINVSGLANLALLRRATASASSLIKGYPQRHQIKFLNDGWYNNCRSWIPASMPAWVEVDLGAVFEISLIKFGSEHAGVLQDRAPVSFNISFQQDRLTEWQSVFQSPADAPPIHGTTEFPIQKHLARFIKIQIGQAQHNDLVRIDEVEIYGLKP